jgi:hypothetical protein
MAILVIGGLLALAAAILGIIFGVGEDWDSSGERAAWWILTVGGAVLLAAGLWYAARSRGIAAGLIIVGALMAGVGIFWSVIVPLAAIVVIVLTIIWLRRPTAVV